MGRSLSGTGSVTETTTSSGNSIIGNYATTVNGITKEVVVTTTMDQGESATTTGTTTDTSGTTTTGNDVLGNFSTTHTDTSVSTVLTTTNNQGDLTTSTNNETDTTTRAIPACAGWSRSCWPLMLPIMSSIGRCCSRRRSFCSCWGRINP